MLFLSMELVVVLFFCGDPCGKPSSFLSVKSCQSSKLDYNHSSFHVFIFSFVVNHEAT